MHNSQSPTTRPRVFLSYAHSDDLLAQRVREALTGFEVVSSDPVSHPAANAADWLRQSLRASDVVVVLLSPASTMSKWVNSEVEYALSRDLDRRGADLIPVLIAPTDLPPSLRDRQVLDLTGDIDGGLQRLVQQIEMTALADFDGMGPLKFELLIADLLRALGFDVEIAAGPGDMGADMRATYQRSDPFGSPETDVWLVETKLYSHQRISVEIIRRLAGVLAVSPGRTRGLLVTNAQLTSVAEEYVAELEQSSHITLRVVDGVELKRLLRQFPSVVSRHFGSAPTARRDGDS